MPYLDSVQELLEAKEGEMFSLRKRKIGLTLVRPRNAAVP